MSSGYGPYGNQKDIEFPQVDAKNFSIEDHIDLDDLSWFTQGVETVYREIRKKSIFDELLSPVSGEFYRIKADGEAWKQSAKSIGATASNLEYNARILTSKYWKGEASEEFKAGVINGWNVGLLAMAGTCYAVGEGLSRIADAAIKGVIHLAETVVPNIIEIIGRAIARGIPALGTIWEIGEALINWEAPYYRHIEDIQAAIESAIAIHRAIEALISVAAKYQAAIDGIGKIVEKISDLEPGVGPSQTDIASVASAMKDGAEAVKTYTGTPEKDKDGTWVRDKDGNVKFGPSEHNKVFREAQRAMSKAQLEMDKSTKRRKGR